MARSAVTKAAVRGVDLRRAAQELTPLALETLVEIMRGASSDSARLAAAREVLDRAHGKPKAGAGEGEEPTTFVARRLEDLEDPS